MVNCVSLVYFSATKTTQKNLRAIAEGIGLPVKEYDFTLPQNRSADITFGPDELVLAGAPVYGGVMPLLEREYLESMSAARTPRASSLLSTATAPMTTAWSRWRT